MSTNNELVVKEKQIDESNNKRFIADIPINKFKFRCFVNNVKATLMELSDSIRKTQLIEKNLFQTELKLFLDNQHLMFQLDKEKYNNARLKKFASSGNLYIHTAQKKAPENSTELKTIEEKCNILTDVLRKRNCQLNKAKREIEIKETQINNLQKANTVKEKKYRRLLIKHAELYSKLKTTDNNDVKNLKNGIVQLQAQIKNQEKQNYNLMFVNNTLKKALSAKMTLERGIQVCEADFQNSASVTG